MDKRDAADLALLGGPPRFAEPLHVGYPNLADRARLLERFNAVLDSRRLTNRGPMVREFERRLAEFIGVRHCIAMCNATVALEIVTRALGMQGEVIVPSMTFVATAHALQWQQITPVFCDIEPESQNLDAQRVEELITPRTTGIVGVHLWGRACNVEALRAVADRHGLRLVFDAAHAFGCSHNGRMVGGFGDAEVFSFHATKVLNTFEGGAVATNDDALAEKVRLMQNFGFAGYDNVIHVGTNGKMNELSAAMGLTSLEHLDEFIARNRANHRRYVERLEAIDGLRVIRYDERERSNYHYVIVDLDAARFGIDRDQMLHVLHAERVLARRYFFPGAHRMEPYRSHFPHARLLLPNTERLLQRVIALPSGAAVGPAEIDAIAALFAAARRHAGAVREHFARLGDDAGRYPEHHARSTRHG